MKRHVFSYMDFDFSEIAGVRRQQQILTVLLLAADILFLWMFLSAESIVQMAGNGQVSGYGPGNIHLEAARFAARWKHGMAGNSPLYMPGFFCVGIFTWLGSLGRPIRKAVPNGVALMVAALPIAALLAPKGAQYAVRSFELVSGLSCTGSIPGYSLSGIAVSLYTLVTWEAGIFCVQLSVARRSIKFIAIPFIMNVILLRLRPWAVNDYLTQWMADVLDGLPIAILSLLAVPFFTLLLLACQSGIWSMTSRKPLSIAED
jgi:hypothetical protein